MKEAAINPTSFIRERLRASNRSSRNENECLTFCKNEPDCKYYSFNPEEGNTCSVTSDCPSISAICVDSGCVYGQVECDIDYWLDLNIMVATGFSYSGYLDDVEVINMDRIESCSNKPVNYPLAVDHSVAMKHNDHVTICGGFPLTADCYSYYNDKWNLEAFQLEPARTGAKAVEIRPGEWLVMGGEDEDVIYLDETQSLKNGIFTRGPDLPEQKAYGSGVMLNQTHLFVAAGRNQAGYSNKNYLLDIDNDRWTEIASRRVQTAIEHMTGTFYNSTASEIQVANVGDNGIEVYSPRNDFWHSGISFPSPLTRLTESTALQQGPNSFILIGGESNAGYSSDVYLFDEKGFSILKENGLTVLRDRHIVMSISTNDFACA